MCQGQRHHHHEWEKPAVDRIALCELVLAGPVGSGKTALVERLARKLNKPLQYCGDYE